MAGTCSFRSASLASLRPRLKNVSAGSTRISVFRTIRLFHETGSFLLEARLDSLETFEVYGDSPARVLVLQAIMPVSMPILEINEIRRILPHRYPMLLVDRILELEAERIVGLKNVTANEAFFSGHFPDFPVMPGVLIVEAMAQTAGVLVLKSIPDRESKLVLLVAIEYAKFRKPVVPGDQLRIEMTVLRRKASVAKMAGRATVDGVVVAEAEVMCKLEDKDPAMGSPA
jgi:3-hydroxyacyl-[acyl-carrier-protein] dehydratase